MARLFTSDTHFGDTRILHSAKRRFASIAEHDAHLVARWQAIVGADDEVWHLGDVAPRYGIAGARRASGPPARTQATS